MYQMIRLHLLGLPHTIINDQFSHCAFTGKIKRFSPMMQSIGFEVFHYGIESSESGADKDISVLSLPEWNDLRVKSYQFLHPTASAEEAEQFINDPSSFIGELGNITTPLYQEFNKRLIPLLEENYRSVRTDIICLPFGHGHEQAVRNLPMVCVETGIGYERSFLPFRVFESYAWMHYELGKKEKFGENYWFVAPNYFEINDWPLSLSPKIDTVGFLGRIYDGKGCHEIVEMAKRMPDVRFIICGQGDPSKYLVHPNIVYKPPIHGTERAEYLGSLVAYLAPTSFVEPFCGAAVEAQLCGTPVITKDYGAQTETVEQGVTGLRCHTLEDYCVGIRMAQRGEFNREKIRERAVTQYDMKEVARTYDYIFRCILDVYRTEANGWYSPTSYLSK